MPNMKRNLILLLLSLVALLPAAADNRSAELLVALQERMEAMEGYRVDFEVEVAGHTYRGYYCVRGEAYYMSLMQAEVYCDGETRYEIDPAKMEVVIDSVDPTSRNILNNPTRAFHLLDSDYHHETLSEAAGIASLLITPTSRRSGISRITLHLDTESLTPRYLLYDADGEQVKISISALKGEKTPLPKFDAARYSAYEMIDFR